MPRILIVDDEPGIRQSLKGVFDDEGFFTDAVSSGEECLAKMEQEEELRSLMEKAIHTVQAAIAKGKLA